MARRAGTWMACACAAAAIAVGTPTERAAAAPIPLPLSATKIYDLGTADVDGDRDEDVFTVNHSYRGSLLLNHGSGDFSSALYRLGFAQDPLFPGLEAQAAPDLAAPGVYVYFHNRDLIVAGRALSGPAELRLEFRTRASVVDAVGASAQTSRVGRLTRVSLTLGQNGKVALAAGADEGAAVRPALVALPIHVALLDGIGPGATYVGAAAVNPPDGRFVLRLRDRHAIAWGDVNADGRTDAFVVRGGLRGQISRYAGKIQDELLVAGAGGFRNRYRPSELEKGPCRGRSAAAVDFNGDRRLDLFEGCQDTRALFFRGHGDGTFDPPISDLGAASGQQLYRWFDLDRDGRLELIVAQPGLLEAFERRDGGWVRTEHVVTRNTGHPSGITVSDFDNDGDPDVFVAAPSGNTLLVRAGGRLQASDPVAVGLPAAGARSACWVDFDNDGASDIDLGGAGIYRQRGDGFRRVFASPGADATTIHVWPDLDGDGDRDLVAAWDDGRMRWQTQVNRNSAGGGHWLEFDPAAGAAALGTKIQVTTATARQTRWVGESECSLRSQGQYRVFFGLGAATQATVRVTGPDGSVEWLGTVAADQRLDL